MDKKTIIYSSGITLVAAIFFPLNWFIGILITFFVSHSLLKEKQKQTSQTEEKKEGGNLISNEMQQKIFDAMIATAKQIFGVIVKMLKILWDGWKEFNR